MINNISTKYIGFVIDASNSQIKLEYASDEQDGAKRGRHIVREIRKLQEVKRKNGSIDRHEFDRYRQFVDADTLEFEIHVFKKDQVVYS